MSAILSSVSSLIKPIQQQSLTSPKSQINTDKLEDQKANKVVLNTLSETEKLRSENEKLKNDLLLEKEKNRELGVKAESSIEKLNDLTADNQDKDQEIEELKIQRNRLSRRLRLAESLNAHVSDEYLPVLEENRRIINNQ
jgi:hypothetical protein